LCLEITFTISQIEEQKTIALGIAQQYAKNARLKEAFIDNDRELLNDLTQPIYQILNENNSVTVFEYGDSKGNVFLRGHNPDKYGDNKSSDPAILEVLQGRNVVGFVFGESGLAIRAIVPVRSNENTIGTFQIGFNLNQELLSKFSELVGSVALFEEDQLIQSTSQKEAEMIGILTEERVYNRLSNGEEIVTIHKNDQQLTFLPMLHPVSGNIQGMFRLNQDISFLSQRKKENTVINLSIIIVTILITLLVAFLIRARSPFTPFHLCVWR
jgi:methyl-accepting chemotaxis protein